MYIGKNRSENEMTIKIIDVSTASFVHFIGDTLKKEPTLFDIR